MLHAVKRVKRVPLLQLFAVRFQDVVQVGHRVRDNGAGGSPTKEQHFFWILERLWFHFLELSAAAGTLRLPPLETTNLAEDHVFFFLSLFLLLCEEGDSMLRVSCERKTHNKRKQQTQQTTEEKEVRTDTTNVPQ